MFFFQYLDEILIDLTEDDLRHLCLAEDELSVTNGFERIFPTETSHVYHPYIQTRYYNQLFDAWECKYNDNRDKGIQRLQSLFGSRNIRS